ncbi:MAG: hypothetical protein M0Z73_14150 [Betaproteobacteria bacterium]|nr:hypothetical protein [Betaproteobacteria bacterium]
MPSRRLLSWLFALALLFGQAAAFAHALTHLRVHDTGLPDKVCEVCLAQAQLGAALPPSPVVVASTPIVPVYTAGAALAWTDLAPRPACARAPPAPSNA